MKALRLMRQTGHQVESIIHIGANEGQERHDYAASGANPCIYVEPVSEIFDRLTANIVGMQSHVAVRALCSDREGEQIVFNVANNDGLSSSMLDLGSHAEFHPSVHYTSSEVMTTTTVDLVLERLGLVGTPNLMIVDTQGADLKVLHGARDALSYIDGVFVEVSREPLYAQGCTQEQVTAYLNSMDLHLAWMSLDFNGHGDAFYCRVKGSSPRRSAKAKNLALGKVASQSSTSIWSRPSDAMGGNSGMKTGKFGFHTGEEQNPWWQVDLGGVAIVSEIKIFNRLDAAADRAKSIQVLMSLNGNEWNMIHDQNGRVFGGIDGNPLLVRTGGVSARYIRLQLNERTMLHLDEVEVY